MLPIRLDVSRDTTRLLLGVGGEDTELTAEGVDRLIRHLAECRAAMSPVHPAEPPDDPSRLHQSDNLLWRVKAMPNRAAIQFATHHPGLGWTAMSLSRAQVEDLVTSIEFELVKIPQTR
jgi:hypothetical protein